MTFADRAGLLRELHQNLRHGRAFLCQQTDIPVLSECVLVLVHPERGEELRLAAQVVMVNPSGIGVSLAGGHAAELEAFAAQQDASTLPPTASGRPTYVPDLPSSGSEPQDRVTYVPDLAAEGGERDTYVPDMPAASEPGDGVLHVPDLPDIGLVADDRVTYVPDLPAAAAAATPDPAATSVDPDPVSEGERTTYVPPAPESGCAGSDAVSSEPPATGLVEALARFAAEGGAPTPIAGSAPEAAAQDLADVSAPAAPYLEIGEPVDEASFADVEQELAAVGSSAPAPAAPESDELELSHGEERELDAEALTPSGRPAHPVELQAQETRQERLRHLNAAQQLKVARTGELADRIAVERLYGKQVWEALLHNPRLSIPEVARIARKGTVPKPLLDVILDNAAWIKADAVRRALLSNPKIGPDAVLKLLRATPKHELKMIEKGTAYGAAVRESARKLLRQ